MTPLHGHIKWPLPYVYEIDNFTTHTYTNQTNLEYAKHCIRFHLPKTIHKLPNYIFNKIDTHHLKGFLDT